MGSLNIPVGAEGDQNRPALHKMRTITYFVFLVVCNIQLSLQREIDNAKQESSSVTDVEAHSPLAPHIATSLAGAADCESSTCRDCRGDCDGCDKCPLCRIIQNTCDKGEKKLKFGGLDICDRCKYCRNGKDECKRKCLLGKQEAVCQNCINSCPKKLESFYQMCICIVKPMIS